MLNLMSDKISFLRSHESSNPNVLKLTSIPMGSLDDHRGIIELQTKMLVVQVLFDIYKIVLNCIGKQIIPRFIMWIFSILVRLVLMVS